MARLAGVDGCRAGWFAVLEDTITGSIIGQVERSFSDFMLTLGDCDLTLGDCDVVAVDIPIGLPERGARACDREARRLLGQKRASSVFPAPIRPVLAAQTYAQANAIRRDAEGKGMSVQAFAIMHKVAEVDAYVRGHGQNGARVYEVHPEVCFMALACGRPMQHNKAGVAGREERRDLLVKEFAPELLTATRANFPLAEVARDDLHDAFVCLWSARRILHGAAERIPRQPELGQHGIDTAIWY